LFVFFVVGCLGHAVSEGVRLPGILGSDSLDMPFWMIWIILVVQGAGFVLKISCPCEQANSQKDFWDIFWYGS
jgi:hypothetical protein